MKDPLRVFSVRHLAEREVLGCADEDSAYLSKRMLRVGTSRQYNSKYTQKGEIIDLSLPAVIPLTVQCSPRALKSYQEEPKPVI